MKKYAILTYWAKGTSNGTAPDGNGPARLNEGLYNSSHKMSDNTVADLIRNEEGKVIQFISQVDALNYCIKLGWNLEQTLFESHEGFNSRDPYSSYIFILSKQE
ncbi:hypothetical protein RF683_00705 [Flavobacterium sp. 20NA77.7]|uniref:Uncharacterized protein n=1 Tax=Flavobacterium nakdongensis TaxID=3073563 RepID=A0ABY9RB03_9FLAO|nr:hypothetical protein [Flavobacterium sp. 20NA77.7]WMW77998.1 hypothetical protein RF683_00705 [Flavobacterium sp. 20NA77.7]